MTTGWLSTADATDHGEDLRGIIPSVLRNRKSRRRPEVRELRCPGCTHLLDGAARHVGEHAALHIVANSPIARLAAWAHERGWERTPAIAMT